MRNELLYSSYSLFCNEVKLGAIHNLDPLLFPQFSRLNYHGMIILISGKKASVLARAAFEITSKHLLNAGLIGEVDKLNGVAENIIVGQPITLGTGAVKLSYRREE